ncbi:MAG: oligosaccharide flippase family protein [bacterium]|nr:oligosaccharide flippase family protein [bacterium]
MRLPFLRPGTTDRIILQNTLSQVIGRLVSSGAMLAASVLIASSFGPEGYGDFVKITTYVALFYLFADFGMNAVYLKKIQSAEERDRKTSVYWPALLAVRLLGSVALVFVALAILSFLPRGDGQGYTSIVRIGIILFSPAIILQAMITSANAVFQENLRYDLSMRAVVAGAVVTLILVGFFSIVSADDFGPLFSALAVGAGTLATACVGMHVVKKFRRFEFHIHSAVMRSLLVASVPLGLTLIFNQISFRADSVILTIYRPTAEIGLYGFAYKIFEVALVLPTFLMNVLYPMLLNAHDEHIRGTSFRFQRIITRSFLLLVAGSVLTFVSLWLLAPYFSLVRPEFYGSIIAMRILSLSLPFFFHHESDYVDFVRWR